MFDEKEKETEEGKSGASEKEAERTEIKVQKSEKGEAKKLSSELEAAKKEIGKLGDELEAANDKYLRMLAEYDNFRRRTQKDRENIYADAYSDALKELLPPDSRILRFQQAFDLTPGTEDEREAVLQWIYHLAPPQQQNVSLSTLPEDTALQKSMKRYLLSGKTFTAASGPLARRFAE